MSDGTVRRATEADYEAVAGFTRELWTDRGGDYLHEVYHDWIAGDDEDQRTFVLEVDGDVAGICQGVVLSAHEAWAQGMRVHPDYRDRGVAHRLTEATFDWAVERGATVCRNMVFSWNAAGLGSSRAMGFDPRTECRWAHPEPDAGAAGPAGYSVHEDPDAAWGAWSRSAARDHLGGLALDFGETWACSELTRADLHRAAEETAVFAVREAGTRAAGVRVRDYERETDEGTRHIAEYGMSAWADLPAARALFAAVRRDAAAIDADYTRVLVPETARHVSDVTRLGADVSDGPVFVLEADLSARE